MSDTKISKDFYHEDGEPVVCETVGELVARLKELPEEMVINQGFGEGVQVVVFNYESPNPFVEFVEVED